MVKGFNEFMGSIGQIGSRVRLVQGFNLFNGSIDLIGVFFNWFNSSIVSISAWVQMDNGFN